MFIFSKDKNHIEKKGIRTKSKATTKLNLFFGKKGREKGWAKNDQISILFHYFVKGKKGEEKGGQNTFFLFSHQRCDI